MAIAHVATEYVFSDFLLKDPPEPRYGGLRVDLALSKMVTCVGVGLPLLLISLAFAQEVSVGTQISCFSPTNFSWRQAGYVDSFCWASVQKQSLVTEHGLVPLWLHKFFPYVLLLVAVLMYVPALFWRFTAAPHLVSDLAFIMEELDRSYNRAIKLAQSLAGGESRNGADAPSEQRSSVPDLTEGFRYPLVEQYLKTKRFSRGLVAKYLICRALTLAILFFACLYLGYYINLASITDEFACNIRTGVLRNDTGVPAAMQCKLVAVGVFQLLSVINLAVYVLLAPAVVYAALLPARRNASFLEPYLKLPTFGVLELGGCGYDDLAVCLLFLEENLSELKSYKRLKVLVHLQETGEGGGDTMGILRALGQVKVDAVDGRAAASLKDEGATAGEGRADATEMKEMSALLPNEEATRNETGGDRKAVRQRL
ncbi:pannexin-1a [Scleropages formosus]|uniref:Pannexin n=1 Tax=Scleropages formosus TaxID=113540 RepID=A0A8C9RY02_SCLFO|nr:pannexin-1 [Scleropages formosus]